MDEIGRPYRLFESKRSYHNLDYGVDWEPFLARYWRAGRTIATGTRVRPTRFNGYEYEATQGGQTGRSEPTWRTTLGGTNADGSVVWTCRPVSTASLLTTVQNSTWEVDGQPAGAPTLSNDSFTGQVTTVWVGGGTSGQRYSLLNRVQLANSQQVEAELVIPVQD